MHRRPDCPAYWAQLSLRAMILTLEVPKHHPQAKTLQPMDIHVLWVEEIDPPPTQAAITWLLLTTLPIADVEGAWQCIRWYGYRWFIERFHYVLKQGCGMEALQLASAMRLKKALATYSIVACRILGLTHAARLEPEQSCEQILEPAEWRVLRRKFEPKNRSKRPPSFAQAIRWIAQLGGFMGSKQEQPGVKTLWRGISKLQQLMEGVQLAAKS
ncbi:IS4 family transposase [Cylindrospermopsis raciborskii]|uniref:IS4 family transposase n=1 Tax=Cylindrospermopsis raciborskii TaxID=77022 RepID=UPI0038CF66B5